MVFWDGLSWGAFGAESTDCVFHPLAVAGFAAWTWLQLFLVTTASAVVLWWLCIWQL
jgi:hypothetical protein